MSPADPSNAGGLRGVVERPFEWAFEAFVVPFVVPFVGVIEGHEGRS